MVIYLILLAVLLAYIFLSTSITSTGTRQVSLTLAKPVTKTAWPIISNTNFNPMTRSGGLHPLLSVVAPPMPSSEKRPQIRKPNIIFAMADDLGWGMFSITTAMLVHQT